MLFRRNRCDHGFSASLRRRLIGLTFFVASLCGNACMAEEIWLDALDPLSRARLTPEIASDYLDLFRKPDEWAQTSKFVNYVAIPQTYILSANDEDLKLIFNGLHRAGLKLVVGGLMVPRETECGNGVEGFSAPGSLLLLALKIKRLGGDINAVVMDEPLWYGHHFDGKNACKFSIAEVATLVAKNVAAVHKIFPSAGFGDVEPVGPLGGAIWNDELIQFAEQLGADSGIKLRFIQADIQWIGDWPKSLADFGHKVHKAGLEFGVIYDGDGRDPTDQAWVARAYQRLKQIEGKMHLAPDQAVFASWHPHPYYLLPETRPGSLTSLVLKYNRDFKPNQ